jgi:hypothetical protein
MWEFFIFLIGFLYILGLVFPEPKIKDKETQTNIRDTPSSLDPESHQPAFKRWRADVRQRGLNPAQKISLCNDGKDMTEGEAVVSILQKGYMPSDIRNLEPY